MHSLSLSDADKHYHVDIFLSTLHHFFPFCAEIISLLPSHLFMLHPAMMHVANLNIHLVTWMYFKAKNNPFRFFLCRCRLSTLSFMSNYFKAAGASCLAYRHESCTDSYNSARRLINAFPKLLKYAFKMPVFLYVRTAYKRIHVNV